MEMKEQKFNNVFFGVAVLLSCIGYIGIGLLSAYSHKELFLICETLIYVAIPFFAIWIVNYSNKITSLIMIIAFSVCSQIIFYLLSVDEVYIDLSVLAALILVIIASNKNLGIKKEDNTINPFGILITILLIAASCTLWWFVFSSLFIASFLCVTLAMFVLKDSINKQLVIGIIIYIIVTILVMVFYIIYRMQTAQIATDFTSEIKNIIKGYQDYSRSSTTFAILIYLKEFFAVIGFILAYILQNKLNKAENI